MRGNDDQEDNRRKVAQPKGRRRFFKIFPSWSFGRNSEDRGAQDLWDEDYVRPSPSAEAEGQKIEALEQKRFALLYASEISTRYHRSRATFLTRFDTFTNVLTLFVGAGALGAALGRAGQPALVALSATVSLIGIVKIVARVGAAANEHTGWMRRWATLSENIHVNEHPTEEDIAQWTRERFQIERECVGELRALCVASENDAARVLGVPDRFRKVWPLQRLFIHLGTFQWTFRFAKDPHAPLPNE